MPNYRLEFRMLCDDGLGEQSLLHETVVRVIRADNERLARQVGEAMLDDEVGPFEWLRELRDVRCTDQQVQPIGWTSNHIREVWDRVLERLASPNVSLVKKQDGTIVGITERVQP